MRLRDDSVVCSINVFLMSNVTNNLALDGENCLSDVRHRFELAIFKKVLVLLFHDPIAITRGGADTIEIDNLDTPPGVSNSSCSLERVRYQADAGALDA